MANLTYTVPNKNGSYDGDMVVKEYTDVTINAGDLVTTDQPCRGLFIYCKGNMTVNGVLSMSAKGAAANPSSSGGSDSNAVDSNGLRYGFFDGSSSDSLTMDGTTFNGCGTAVRSAIAAAGNGAGTTFKVHAIPRTASSAAARPLVSLNGDLENPAQIRGGNGSYGSISHGGGGSGGQAYEIGNGKGGAAGNSTCFSGGSGGGGAAGGGSTDSGHIGGAANNYGGVGGVGGNHNENSSRPTGTGGAGNPGGNDGSVGVGGSNNAGDGTGGLIILVVGGNLTIGASGEIRANGTQGGDSTASGDNSSMGGGSGGGHVVIICKGTVTANSSTISAGQYVGNAGSTVGSAGTYGTQGYNLATWGGRGGKSSASDCPVQNMYTGTSLTRQGGTGGKGLISIYSAA